MAEKRILKVAVPLLPSAKGDEWPMVKPSEPYAPSLPPGQEWPKISIVTPSFNQGPFLEKTIRSVLLQGYPNLEYIVIDGGSTDQSVEIIRKYESWIDYWVSEKDAGQSHAINKGLAKASGELLGWLNSDDYYTEGALFKLAETYLQDSSYGAYYGQGHIVNEDGSIHYTPDLQQVTKESLFEWDFGKNFMQPSCLFTQKAWRDCGPLDENIHIALDVDLWLKIADKYRFSQINELLSISLAHENAKTTAYRHHMLLDLSFVLLRHGGVDAARRTLEKTCDRLVECEEIIKKLKTIEKNRLSTKIRAKYSELRKLKEVFFKYLTLKL